MEPQAETHDDSTCGAYEVFDEAGLQVVASANIQVPQGRNIWDDMWLREGALDGANVPVPPGAKGGDNGLAEVTHVRQFFLPGLWILGEGPRTSAGGVEENPVEKEAELSHPEGVHPDPEDALHPRPVGVGSEGAHPLPVDIQGHDRPRFPIRWAIWVVFPPGAAVMSRTVSYSLGSRTSEA